ncbi:MAG: ATP-binding cassette domain-containing protein [Planctomycetota bacterium]
MPSLSAPHPTDHVFDNLEMLAAGSGVPFDPVAARHAIESGKRRLEPAIEGEWPGNFLAIADAAKSIGMDARPVDEPLRKLLNLAREGAPVLVGSKKLPMGVVLLRASGRKVLIADRAETMSRRWIPRLELLIQLGIDSDKEVVEAILVQPQLPYQPMHHGHGHGHRVSPLRRLMALLQTERSDIHVVVVYAIGISILTLATPLAVETLVNSIAFGRLIQPLIVVSLLLLASLGFAAVLRIMQTILVELLQRRILIRLVADLAYRLPRVQVSAFDRQHGPELVNRFFDVVTVQKVCATLLLEGVGLVLSAFIGALLLAVYHPFLLIYDIVLVFGMTVVTYLLGRGAIRTSVAESLAKYDVADSLEEIARLPIAFKQGAGPTLAIEHAESRAHAYLAARVEHFRVLLRQIIFALSLQALASTALLGLGGWLVMSGQLTLGQLVAAELIVTVVIGSFAKIGKHLESYYDLMAAMDKIGHLIDIPLEEEGTEEPSSERPSAKIALRDVHFRHGEGGRVLFDHFSLDIEPGERVAVAGPSGVGKTTFLELLYGLRLPTFGGVCIDGIDTRVIRLSELRRSAALLRDFDVVAGTVLDNVRMGRHGITSTQVSEALARVGLLDDLARMPEGLNTPLTPTGSPLSRGQVRRVLLARAIVGKPRLILIDGVLDGFDLELRKRMTAILVDHDAPWTAIIVSQCPDVVAACDRSITFQSP